MWNAAGGLLLENLAPGKALTGGCTGQAVAAADHRVYEGFCGDAPRKALMHGLAFIGNALACRVAAESMELFEEGHYLFGIYLSGIRRTESLALIAPSSASFPTISNPLPRHNRSDALFSGCQDAYIYSASP